MSHKILIVDDENSIVIPLQFLLEQNGYQVLIAHNGEDALEIIDKELPDLIILDIMLPGIDGYEVCEMVRLKPEWRDIRIIFLTAKGREVDMAKGLVLGADAYLIKPFSNADVLRNVKALLSGSHIKK